MPRTSVSLCAGNSVLVAPRPGGYVWVGLWVVEVVTLDCKLIENVRASRGAHLAWGKAAGARTLLRLVKVKVTV